MLSTDNHKHTPETFAVLPFSCGVAYRDGGTLRLSCSALQSWTRVSRLSRKAAGCSFPYTDAGNKQYKSYGPPLTRNGQPQPMQDILGCPTASECELRNFSDCLGREDPALLARQQKEISVLTVRKCVYSSKAKIMLIKLQSNFVYWNFWKIIQVNMI